MARSRVLLRSAAVSRDAAVDEREGLGRRNLGLAGRSPKRPAAITLLSLSLLASLSCGPSPGNDDTGAVPPEDAGAHVAPDAGPDLVEDAGLDAGTELPPDAGAVPPSGFPVLAFCPTGPKPLIPAGAPRILILRGSRSMGVSYGPLSLGDLARDLRGLLAADSAFHLPVVDTVDIATSTSTSLLAWYYAPVGRTARLAPLAGPWTYVVLLDDQGLAESAPELHFEGVRAVACHARQAGATPILLTGPSLGFSPLRSELAWRVGNGAGLPVVPAGEAWRATSDVWGPTSYAKSTFVAAASLYSAITGRSGATAGKPYVPAALTPADAAHLAWIAYETVGAEAGRTHYSSPFSGVVQMQTAPGSGRDFWFMDSGTSSEAIWQARMNEIVPRLGLTPRATSIGVSNPTKTFDAACLANAQGRFSTSPYELLFARDYSLDGATIRAAASPGLQVQVWDRHLDGMPVDGIAELSALESRLLAKYQQARRLGLALIPHHLAFARLKAERPSIDLTSDGTHTTYPVGYALATMSVVSRLGRHVPTTGLDADTERAAAIAEETIRQLSSLSATGEFVPDLPSARPSLP